MFSLVGNTPHVRFPHRELPHATIHLKLEGCNPTGSIKDRACVEILRSGSASGKLKPGITLLDASSGNMACAIAYYGRLLGCGATVVVSSKITADKKNFIRYFGATLVQVGHFTIDGNRYCRELMDRHGTDTYWFLDQLHNWDNPKGHFQTTGPEIHRDFPDVAMIVGSLGSGGTMLGVGEYFRRHRPQVRIVTVQAAPGSKIPGAGTFDDGDYVTPFITKGIDKRIFDHAIKVTEAQALRGLMALRAQGVFCGPQTGAVLEAALTAARELRVRGDIVLLSGDAGWKNTEKLMSTCGDEQSTVPIADPLEPARVLTPPGPV